MIELYPAIDLRGGRAVRLLQGDYGRETVYGADPIEVADTFAAAGAQWIHVVDLDAARTGEPVNRPVIAAITKRVEGRAKVQTGGGVRSAKDAKALADLGVSRAVMGSAAVRFPGIVAHVSSMIEVAVALDHRDGEVAVHGWTEGSGVKLVDLLGKFPTAVAFVVTNIARDGMLTGPDLEGLAAAAALTEIPVIASGGIASVDDIVALDRTAGLSGAIIGKALYEKRFTLDDAFAALERDRLLR